MKSIRLFMIVSLYFLGFIACDDAQSPMSTMDPTGGTLSGGTPVDPGGMITNDNDMMDPSDPDAFVTTDLDVMPEVDIALPPTFGLSLNSVVPNRGFIAGGEEIQIIGTGFTRTTQFKFADIACTEVRIENASRARCLTPEGPAVGPVAVSAYDERVEMGMIVPDSALLEDGFNYYIPVEIEAISPERGPLSGNTRLNITGTGFTDQTTVQFGSIRSLEVEFLPNGSLSALIPPAEISGAVDIKIQNQNGIDTLPMGYYYYERLVVDQLEPAIGGISGGTRVRIRGSGFLDPTLVEFNGQEATIVSIEANALEIETPPGSTAGFVDLHIENQNGEVDLTDAFLYFDDQNQEFAVVGMSPAQGPIEGGQVVYIAGSGFEDGARVTIDGRDVDCERVDANQLRCITAPSSIGEVDVAVSQGELPVFVPGGYAYFQNLELITLFPSRGSIAGGTLIELTGRGFTQDTEFFLGEQILTEIMIIDEITARGVSPTGPASTVDVIARNQYDQDVIGNGYEYFDPASGYGGVWGEELEVAMNITVLNGNTFEPEPEVHLLLITEEFLALEGLTDETGRATLSHPSLDGRGNITAAKEGFEVTTMEMVGVENITIILFPQPEGDGQPPPPPPPATLRGTVRGLDLLPKPNSETYVNVVLIETSHSQPSNRADLPPPGPGGLLYEDGAFEIISRLGELAIVGTGGRLPRSAIQNYENETIGYWEMREEFEPLVMGLRRFISARAGETTEGLYVELDHPLDYQIPVDFDNPPYDPPNGPSYYGILPRLNLGAEGFWELDTSAFGPTPNLAIPLMPRLDGWGDDIQYFLLNFAFNPNSQDSTPMSVNIKETNDVGAGVFVTPFSSAAIFIDPTPNGTLNEDRILSWRLSDGYEGPIDDPSGTLITVAEPALGPPTPLWRYVVPSGQTSVQIPTLSPSAGETGLGSGVMFLDISPFVADGRFDYDDFNYLDINGARWASYGTSSTVFTAQ
jgi:hypothetical protein